MVTLPDYVALSAIIYNDKRNTFNKILPDPPAGWTELPIYPNGITGAITGFNARAYSNGADIVIAYEGTDTANVVQTAQDFLFGNAAALGGSVQLIQAALFYEQVKAANPNANITFTGHSLGGGLASVMGVWFGKSATTFAEAPFGAAAVNPFAIAAVEAALVSHLYFDSDFLLFNPLDYTLAIRMRWQKAANDNYEQLFLERSAA